jgi:ABC-2 type transport system permease protein
MQQDNSTNTSIDAAFLQPRQIGRVNGRGLWTLYTKETRRFMSVWMQTLMAPVVTTLLFMAIFYLALGGAVREINGMPFIQFLAPGLLAMTVAQNAFANTSSSIIVAKIQGNIVDVLMPPLNAKELTLAYAAGGVTRGLFVGAGVFVMLKLFVPFPIQHPLWVLYFLFSAALMLSLLGMVGGIWARKFDHMSAMTNFVVTPLSFLSGTFYSIDRLPEVWQKVTLFNPFFHMINGIRYGFIGLADSSIIVGALFLACFNVVLLIIVHAMFRSGYKLRP